MKKDQTPPNVPGKPEREAPADRVKRLIDLAVERFGPELSTSDLRMVLHQEFRYRVPAERGSLQWEMEPDPESPGRYRRARTEIPDGLDPWLIVYHPSFLELLASLRNHITSSMLPPHTHARHNDLARLRELGEALAFIPPERPGRPRLRPWERADRSWTEAERQDFAAIVDELARAVPREVRSHRDIEDVLRDDVRPSLQAALSRHILPWAIHGEARFEIAVPEIAAAIVALRKALRQKHPRRRALASIAKHWRSAKKPLRKRAAPHPSK